LTMSINPAQLCLEAKVREKRKNRDEQNKKHNTEN
jgi:hypothetical protein